MENSNAAAVLTERSQIRVNRVGHSRSSQYPESTEHQVSRHVYAHDAAATITGDRFNLEIWLEALLIGNINQRKYPMHQIHTRVGNLTYEEISANLTGADIYNAPGIAQSPLPQYG